MNLLPNHIENEKKDRVKSAIITLLILLFVLTTFYFYKFTRIVPRKNEVVTTMLINFGDQKEGEKTEEPTPEKSATTTPSPPKKTPVTTEEKILTGKNKKISVPKVERPEKKANRENIKPEKKQPETTKKNTTKSTDTKNKSKTELPSQQDKKGDSKGTAAIGNLIKGRGNTKGNQGTRGTSGNSGDPLGGDSNGDSKIGVDRKLIAFIPGTMGRGGSQPSHNCTASGTISIAYEVDKAGNVTSARRSGGISDPCVVSTTVSWVKRYVKAERASSSSTGTYRITF